MTDNYPDDIRQHDNNPESPFYVDKRRNVEALEICDAICGLYHYEITELIDKLETVSGAAREDAIANFRQLIFKIREELENQKEENT